MQDILQMNRVKKYTFDMECSFYSVSKLGHSVGVMLTFDNLTYNSYHCVV